MTAAAAAIMAVNVWGLLRLRTWALFSSMLANVGIAALALGGALAVGPWVAPVLLRVVVPAAVLVTIVAAVLHLRWSLG